LYLNFKKKWGRKTGPKKKIKKLKTKKKKKKKVKKGWYHGVYTFYNLAIEKKKKKETIGKEGVRSGEKNIGILEYADNIIKFTYWAM